ncbi:MAG: GerMN domain-containing protein [Treponema sp.]|nr:GerMN domain-containing protein [Treponema sp.]
MAEKKNTKKSKNKTTGIGLAIWLIIAIVLVIIFLVKWPDIHNNLIRSGLIQGTITEKPEKPEKTEKSEKKNKTEKSSDSEPKSEAVITIKPEQKPEIQITQEPSSDTKPVTEKIPATTDSKPAEQKKEDNPNVKPAEPVKIEPPAPVQTSAKICFVVIDADGTVNYKTVSRSVTKTDSPLTTALNVLLEGPSVSEKNCTTLIPKGTKLLSASVKNDVAFLNFNDAFEFNPDGIEGYVAQLKQIIITATEFKTVNSVQFLINGQKKEYLGSDGVYIGAPLSRTSL